MIYTTSCYIYCKQFQIIDGKAIMHNFNNEYRCQDTYIYFIRHNVHAYNSKTNNTKLSEYNSISRIIHKYIKCKKNTS